MTYLADRTWPDVERLAPATDLMLCLGSLEQHGPHLPLDTDTEIVTELARRWAQARPQRMVGPVIPIGASGEHADFPGTISIGTRATTEVITEAVRSCGHFRSVVVASWHGGNGNALAAAARTLGAEGRPVRFWSPTIAGDAHAGRVETSMMLAIAPQRVRLEAAEPGVPDPLPTLMGRLRAAGVRSVAANGVLGDPTGASAEEGAVMLADIVARYEEAR
ncbi:MAG: mycofactocin biosynthesis peptidyl-dipeptidase MftE [Acidimicrobiia bacterium]|nr:mycofactocin biosynthesis peptidyl-dipeptidase MftE [Acidimicrobiia bacterium]